MKAVIWDMDGVLIDSETLYNKANPALFEKLGIPFWREDEEGLAGVNAHSGALGIMKRHPDVKFSLEEVEEMYRASLLGALTGAEDLQLIPGVADWIARLHAMGYKMAVASSSTAPMVNYVAERFGFHDIMGAVIHGEMVKVAKPEPDIFLMAAELIGVRPEDCTVIEDSTFGIRAAKAAGMRCLAFTGANVHNLDNSEADDRFPEYNDEAFNKYFK